MAFPPSSTRRGFTIIESLCMLAAIFMVTWIMAAVLKKNGTWPFKPESAAAKFIPKTPNKSTNQAPVSEKPVVEGVK